MRDLSHRPSFLERQDVRRPPLPGPGEPPVAWERFVAVAAVVGVVGATLIAAGLIAWAVRAVQP